MMKPNLQGGKGGRKRNQRPCLAILLITVFDYFEDRELFFVTVKILLTNF